MVGRIKDKRQTKHGGCESMNAGASPSKTQGRKRYVASDSEDRGKIGSVKETRRGQGPNIGKELSERESRVGRLVTAAFDLSYNGQGWGGRRDHSGFVLILFLQEHEREKEHGNRKE